MSSILPIATQPLAGESLLQYLARCAERNVVAISWILELIGFNSSTMNVRSKFRELLFGRGDTSALARVCGAPDADLSSVVYGQISASTDRCAFGSQVIRTASLSPFRLRYCPACALEGMSRHRLFEISLYTACHRHGCWLEDTNAPCRPTDELRSLDFQRHPEPDPLLRHRAVQADGRAQELSVAIAECAARPPERAVNEDLDRLLRRVEAGLLIEMPESALGRFELSLDHRSETDLRRMAVRAWPWVKDVTSFNDSMKLHATARRAACPDSPYAATAIHVHRVWSQHIDPADPAFGWCQPITDWDATVSLPDAERRALREEFVALREAASILGCSEHVVKKLVDAQFLRDRYAFNDRKYSDRIIELGAIDDLFQRLRAVSAGSIPSWIDNSLAFGDVLLGSADVRARGLQHLLSNVLAGSIRSYLPAGSSLAEMRLAKEDLRVGPITRSEWMSVTDVIERLGSYRDAVYRLIRAGLIATETRLIDRKRQKWVKSSDVEVFLSTYVLPGELASSYGVNVTNLTDRLIDAGILPVSGPRIDRGLIYVFRRADVSASGVAAVLAQPNYRSRAGRRKANDPDPAFGLLDSSQVCARLKVSTQILGRIVKSGVLAEDPRSRSLSNRKFFKAEDVETYERRFLLNPDLIPIAQAAADLGTTVARIHRDFFRTGRLERVDDGAGRIFVDRALVAVMAEKIGAGDQLLSAAEATRALNLRPSEIQNLRRLNKVRVVPTGSHGRHSLYRRSDIVAAVKRR